MESIETQTINALNRLIQTNQDAVDGFRTAIGAIEDDSLKRLFESLAEMHEFMVADLQGEITSLGGSPNEGGTIGGMFQRGWLNLKSVLTGHDLHAVVEEVMHLTDVAMDQYQDALSIEMPTNTRLLLQTHYEKLTAEYDQLNRFELATR